MPARFKQYRAHGGYILYNIDGVVHLARESDNLSYKCDRSEADMYMDCGVYQFVTMARSHLRAVENDREKYPPLRTKHPPLVINKLLPLTLGPTA